MREPMQSLFAAEPDLREHSLVELPPHARLPRLDLGIDWGNRGKEFATSLASLFQGPFAPSDSETAENVLLRVRWVEGRWPVRAFTLSSLWHFGLVWLLTLPIWGFLPQSAANLAPVDIELSWYGQPYDLPPISLPAQVADRVTPRSTLDPAAQAAKSEGTDTLPARQTILSIPVRLTHPRQTLIRPDAPNTPPKIVPQLPNILEWKTAQPHLPRPKFQLSAAPSAPKIEQRSVDSLAAPELPNTQNDRGSLTIAPPKVILARPNIPLSAMSAPKSRQLDSSANAAAPEIAASTANELNRNIIALSATPGPPAPVASVPEGNLAARISTSPAGSRAGEAAGSENRSTASGLAGAAGPGSSSSLPAAISIRGGVEPRTNGGGVAAATGRTGRLDLTPKEPYQPTASAHRSGPLEASRLAPGLPPEKILSSSEIYTMHVNLPNLTSASGSWILNFAELEEGQEPSYRPKQRLAEPVPVHVTDPKYPQDMIKGHVHGEVVLYAIIRKNGSVDSIQIVRDLDPQLDRNAVEALEQWRFEPATRAGLPVDVEAVIHVPFSYTDPREYPSANP